MGGGGGTVIITSAPGPGLCHSQRFFERFFGDSLRDSLEMDLVRSLTIRTFIPQSRHHGIPLRNESYIIANKMFCSLREISRTVNCVS